MDLGFTIDLVPPAEAACTLVGLAFGACMQRLAERSPPPGAWRRALPWLAALAVPLLLVVRTPGTSQLVDLPQMVAILPVGVVALVQIAAAVAGRGRPAPLPRAARWVRAIVLVALCLFPAASGMDPVPCVIVTAHLLAIAGIASMMRRPPLPGAILALEGAILCASLPACVRFAGTDVGDLGTAAVVVAIVSVPATAACVRWCRLDRRSLAAFGIDLGAPGDAAAVVYAGEGLGVILTKMILVGPRGLSFDTALRLEIAMPLVALTLVTLALRYLRRRLDEAEARRPPAPAPSPS